MDCPDRGEAPDVPPPLRLTPCSTLLPTPRIRLNCGRKPGWSLPCYLAPLARTVRSLTGQSPQPSSPAAPRAPHRSPGSGTCRPRRQTAGCMARRVSGAAAGRPPHRQEADACRPRSGVAVPSSWHAPSPERSPPLSSAFLAFAARTIVNSSPLHPPPNLPHPHVSQEGPLRPHLSRLEARQCHAPHSGWRPSPQGLIPSVPWPNP